MGQDEIYLQVIATSGEAHERRNAKKVLTLLKRGKHWVLVTLLLGNVITNETLPIVLDRSLGGGWPAVLGSTVLIGKAPQPLALMTFFGSDGSRTECASQLERFQIEAIGCCKLRHSCLLLLLVSWISFWTRKSACLF
jgi:hypothetical protein